MIGNSRRTGSRSGICADAAAVLTEHTIGPFSHWKPASVETGVFPATAEYISARNAPIDLSIDDAGATVIYDYDGTRTDCAQDNALGRLGPADARHDPSR